MVGLPNRRRGAAALARAFLLPALAAALRTGKVVRRTYEPWLFAQRFCFRGGDSSGSDHSGTFTYRVKSYGLWMLIFTEENFESFKRIQEADYSDMTLQERFDKAEIVQWVGHNETERVTAAAPQLPSSSTIDGQDIVVDTSFWEDLYDLYNAGGNVDSTVPWSEAPRGRRPLRRDFNGRVGDRFDAPASVALRELDESHRFVQKSAESTST